VRGIIAACAGVLLCGVVSGMLVVQAGSSTKDGVYTAAQAEQGHALYTQQCAMCHGDTLQGVGQNPPLAGDAFLGNWTGETMADLYGKIKTTMPATNPGSLTPEQTAQILAYILSSNKFAAGNTELASSPDSLKAIQIDKP
jgi:mono/diheme cytochrome c family protein